MNGKDGVSNLYFTEGYYAKNTLGDPTDPARGNGGNGFSAYYAGDVFFQGYVGGSLVTGGNVIARNRVGGLDASGQTLIHAGEPYTGNANNSLYGNGRPDPAFRDGVGPDARSYYQALTYANKNWWGERDVRPDTTTCGTLPVSQCGSPYARGVLYADHKLTSDPNAGVGTLSSLSAGGVSGMDAASGMDGGGVRLASLSATGAAHAAGAAPDENDPLGAFRTAHAAGRSAEALGHLRRVVTERGRSSTVGVALAAVARLCATEPEATALLTATSRERPGSERALWAASALATCYVLAGREGDALAVTEALTTPPGGGWWAASNEMPREAALDAHLLAVGLHLARGRDDAAQASLAAAHALAPGDRRVAQIAEVVALETGGPVAWLDDPSIESAGAADAVAADDVEASAAQARVAASGTGEATALLAPHPNPSRGTATVRFALEESSVVRLSVFDALGREVAVLADGTMAAGPHAARFDGAALPTGVYLARLTVESAGGAQVTLSQRLTLLR